MKNVDGNSLHNDWTALVIKINKHHSNCIQIPIKHPIPSAKAFVCSLFKIIIIVNIIMIEIVTYSY